MSTLIEGFEPGYDLVARVCHSQDSGWMAYDTDLSYLVSDLSEQELSEITEEKLRELFCTEEGDCLYFAKWLEPFTWSML